MGSQFPARLADMGPIFNLFIPLAHDRLDSIGGLNGVTRYYLSDDPSANDPPAKISPGEANTDQTAPSLFLLHSLTTEPHAEDHDFYRSSVSVLLRNNQGRDLAMWYRHDHPFMGLETVIEVREVTGPWRRTFRFIGLSSAEVDIVDPIRPAATRQEVILASRYWITARGECILRRITLESEGLRVLYPISESAAKIRAPHSLITPPWLPRYDPETGWLVGTMPIPPTIGYQAIWQELVTRTNINAAFQYLGFDSLPELA